MLKSLHLSLIETRSKFSSELENCFKNRTRDNVWVDHNRFFVNQEQLLVRKGDYYMLNVH